MESQEIKKLLQFFRLCVEEIEPLIEKGEEEFEWGFDEEVKEHEENVDLSDTLGQFATYSDNRHEEEVNQKCTYPLLFPYSIDTGEKRNSVCQE